MDGDADELICALYVEGTSGEGFKESARTSGCMDKSRCHTGTVSKPADKVLWFAGKSLEFVDV